MKNIISVPLLFLFISSCAPVEVTDTEGKSRFGGRYEVKKEEDGKIHILAQSNNNPWADYKSARSIWKKQANKKCGDSGYKEEAINEYAYEPIGPYCVDGPLICLIKLKYIAAVKEGYAVCNDTAIN